VREEVFLHSFLTLAVEGSGQFHAATVRGNSSRIEFYSKLGATSAGSTVLEKVKIACSYWYSK